MESSIARSFGVGVRYFQFNTYLKRKVTLVRIWSSNIRKKGFEFESLLHFSPSSTGFLPIFFAETFEAQCSEACVLRPSNPKNNKIWCCSVDRAGSFLNFWVKIFLVWMQVLKNPKLQEVFTSCLQVYKFVCTSSGRRSSSLKWSPVPSWRSLPRYQIVKSKARRRQAWKNSLIEMRLRKESQRTKFPK